MNSPSPPSKGQQTSTDTEGKIYWKSFNSDTGMFRLVDATKLVVTAKKDICTTPPLLGIFV